VFEKFKNKKMDTSLLLDEDWKKVDNTELRSIRVYSTLALLVFAVDITVGWIDSETILDFRTTSLEVEIMNMVRMVVFVVMLLVSLYKPQWAMWCIGFIAYYINLSIVVYTCGKLLMIDYSVVSLFLPGKVSISILCGFVEIFLIYQVAGFVYERSQWDENNEKVEKQQDDDVPKLSKAHLSFYGLYQVLRPYFWPDGSLNKFRCVMTWVFLGLSKVANLLSPIYIGRATESLHDDSDVGVIQNLAIFAFLTLMSKILKEMQNVVYLSVKQTAYVQIAWQTFQHLHKLSLEWHVKKRMGNVLRSMDRGVQAADTVVTYLFLNLVPSVVECAVVFFIFYSHFHIPMLSATAFISFVAYTIVTVNITLWRKKFRVKTNKHDNDFHDKATDSLINYETVKYFTAEEYETNRYTSSIEKYQSYSVSTAYSLSILNSSQNTIIQCCTAISLIIGAHQVLQKNISHGDFMSISVYLGNLFAPLSFLGTVYNMVIQAFVDMSNLSELLAESPDLVDAPFATDLKIKDEGATIDFEKVCFHYPSQPPNQGLSDVSFRVEPGTTMAIVGPTGSGKTTISRLLFRFYDPIQGSIRISGQDIAYVTQLSLRKAIGVVPQDTVLFNDSLEYNLLYGKLNATASQLETACRGAQIWDFIQTLPDGMQTKVGERGLKLSGGEKQRVAIARCLLKNPPIVLLDEATSALDTITERSVQQALNTLTNKRTTVVIAHRLTTIKNAERILVLEHGKVLESGSHQELLDNNSHYSQLWSNRLESEHE